MNYDGTLVMPNNYVVMDNNEMEYLDGEANFGLKLEKTALLSIHYRQLGQP